MQVVPICIVACLLVVSLSSANVYKRNVCKLSDPVKKTRINNVIQRCQCTVNKHGFNVRSCQLLGCKFNHQYYNPGAVYDGCECKKGPEPDIPKDARLYHWSCTCSHGLSSQNYKINAKWTATVDKITKTCTCVRPRKGRPKVFCEKNACRRRVDTSSIRNVLGTCRCVNSDGGLDRWECS